MKFIKHALSYLIANRRVLGVIVGASLSLLGYVEEGKFVEQVGAI